MVGNDVWIGGNTTIMPGVRIGHGAIVSTEVRVLVRLAWWNWPIEVITENIGTISAGLVNDLEQIARTLPADRAVAAHESGSVPRPGR